MRNENARPANATAARVIAAGTHKAASTVAMCDPCSLREMALRDEYHRRTGRFVSLEDFTRGK